MSAIPKDKQGQQMINRVNLVHPPQYAVEGVGPKFYGIHIKGTATSGGANDGVANDFVAPFQMGKMTIAYNGSFVDTFKGGDLDRQGQIKTWEDNTITVSGRVINDSEGLKLLNWAMKKPQNESATATSGANTPDESRTWLYSYKNNNNKLVYYIAKGCKVQSATLRFPSKDIAMLDIEMSCKRLTVLTTTKDGTTAANNPAIPITGEPTGLPADGDLNYMAEDDTGAIAGVGNGVTLARDERQGSPLRFQDLGNFYYRPKFQKGATDSDTISDLTAENAQIKFTSLDLGVQYGLRKQDSNGSDRTTYCDYATRTGSGSVTMFRTGSDTNEDGRSDRLHTAFLEMKNSGTAATHAHGNLGTTNVCRIVATAPGTIGNDVMLIIKTDSTVSAGDETVSVRGKEITLTINDSATTLAQIAGALNSDRYSSQLVHAFTIGTDSTTYSTAQTTAQKLSEYGSGSDGANGTRGYMVFENFKFQATNEDLLDQSEATMESKSIQADSVTALV